MQIVIDIDEESYEHIKAYSNEEVLPVGWYAIINGTPLPECLKELKTYRKFADWLVKAVLEEDWEESADFYAEVLCRKLTKLGKLKVVDNKYMEVDANEDCG